MVVKHWTIQTVSFPRRMVGTRVKPILEINRMEETAILPQLPNRIFVIFTLRVFTDGPEALSQLASALLDRVFPMYVAPVTVHIRGPDHSSTSILEGAEEGVGLPSGRVMLARAKRSSARRQGRYR